MPELIAKPACEARPVTLAGAVLAPLDPGPIWSVALYPGGARAAARGLKALGLGFPEPGTWAAKGAARIFWTGREQAFVAGVAPVPVEGAAVTDQSDAWAGVSLSGPGAEAVLARLVALDLRAAAFPEGRVARVGLNHMSAMILRTGAEAFEIYTFRSMARTAWHELTEAMERLEARAGLKP
ncbi:MAG: sarcosine oxidase subunit gamma [Paracoccaceae bacterium]